MTLRPDPTLRTDAGIVVRGRVDDADRSYARGKLDHVCEWLATPVQFARIELAMHDDPAVARPAFAKAEVDLDGHVTRAHADATTMREAIDLVVPRLRRRLEERRHRAAQQRLRQQRANSRHDQADDHHWRHGDRTAPRPSYFPRPTEEREVVRHKTFAVVACTPDEAAADLEALDHAFYLFVNVETGEDNMIARQADAGYVLAEPAATRSLHETAATIAPDPVRPTTLTREEAEEILDLTDAPFVFHLDPASGRGRVLYRRYDGHYGLIVPADTD